jgi:hypothetical protein
VRDSAHFFSTVSVSNRKTPRHVASRCELQSSAGMSVRTTWCTNSTVEKYGVSMWCSSRKNFAVYSASLGVSIMRGNTQCCDGIQKTPQHTRVTAQQP